jgi:hypothetical protein
VAGYCNHDYFVLLRISNEAVDIASSRIGADSEQTVGRFENVAVGKTVDPGRGGGQIQSESGVLFGHRTGPETFRDFGGLASREQDENQERSNRGGNEQGRTVKVRQGAQRAG